MRLASVLTFGVACGLVVGTMSAADPLAPIPPAPAVASAEKEIRNVYKAEYAKKKAPEQIELARKLLKAGEATKNDPASRYTMYREARTIATRAGDVALALDAAMITCREFEVNQTDLIIATLVAAEKVPNPPLKAVVDVALDAADDHAQADDYTTAARYLNIAAGAATRSNVPALAAAVSTRTRDIDAARKAFEATEPERKVLAKTPDDPIAASRVGRFLCLVKGDWQAGLPLLAKGEDEKLKAAATKDLARPSNALTKVEAGDAWYDLGDGFDARERATARVRAFQWYHQAAPFLTGLPRDRADKRIEELGKLAAARVGRAAPGGWRILFRSADPAIWNTDTFKELDQFAFMLTRAPAETRYLKMTNTEKGEFVIIEMTRSRLAEQTEQNGYGWNGRKVHNWNGHHLGIYDVTWTDNERGYIFVSFIEGKAFYRGWGFGHRSQIADQQGYSWNGQPIDKTVFEIAVKTTPLTSEEAKRLHK